MQGCATRQQDGANQAGVCRGEVHRQILACVQAPMQGWDTERQDRALVKQGWPQILTDLRIVGENGRELPRDGKAFGELQARGPHTLQRYHKVCPEWCCLGMGQPSGGCRLEVPPPCSATARCNQSPCRLEAHTVRVRLPMANNTKCKQVQMCPDAVRPDHMCRSMTAERQWTRMGGSTQGMWPPSTSRASCRSPTAPRMSSSLEVGLAQMLWSRHEVPGINLVSCQPAHVKHVKKGVMPGCQVFDGWEVMRLMHRLALLACKALSY